MSHTFSAPGKSILIGEHAAVYGRPALVAALDQRVTGRLDPDPGGRGLRVMLSDLGLDERWTWQAAEAYAIDRRRAWQRWSASAGALPFTDVLGERRSHLVKVAAGEALAIARSEGRSIEHLPPARLEIRSAIPLGAGFGSSAAVAAVTVSAILAHARIDADADLVEAIVLDAERRQHGSPSGVDGAVVVNGGVLWVEKRAEPSGAKALVIEPVELAAPDLLDGLRIVHSGTPAETTGEVVAAVAARRALDPVAFEVDLDGAARATTLVRQLLEQPLDTDSAINSAINPRQALVAPLRKFGHWLEAQGVVPQAVCSLARQVEAAGGAGKISGAGSLAGPGAGSFLVYHPDPARADLLARRSDLPILDVRFGAPGLRSHPS